MDILGALDGATVVAGPASVANRKELLRERGDDFPAKPYFPIANGTSKAKTVGHAFSTSLDYAIEDRPFFVPIGKDGVTAALQKLDKQLQQVCNILVLHNNHTNSCNAFRREGVACCPRRRVFDT